MIDFLGRNSRIGLLASVVFFPLALSLAGCQTTAGQAQMERSDRIDAVLSRAAAEASAQGETKESLAILERIYKRDAANAENAVKYAEALRDAGRFNRAALVLAPFAEGQNPAADILTEYASVQAAMGDYAMAETYARQAVLKSPDSGKAYHVLGV